MSCGPSTTIQRSWSKPGVSTTNAGIEKILVVSFIKDESSRRVMEDGIVKMISKTNAVPSYTMFTEQMIKNASPDALNELLVKNGFSHLVLVRLTEIEKEQNFVPGAPMMGPMMMGPMMGPGMGPMGFNGGWGMHMGMGMGGWNQGFYQTDKNYFIETSVYDINPSDLLWTGMTKTVNPNKMDKKIRDVARAVKNQMEKDGFLVR